MAQDNEPPDDLKEFLPTTEDFARVLDRKAANARTEEAVRKTAQNANFAAAVAALNNPVEEPPRPVQASERVEYNPAKTVPPRTRRDTLEVQQRIEVAPALLDPRHRPTERIARVQFPPQNSVQADRAEAAAAPPSTPPAPAVEQVDGQPPARSRGLYAALALLLGVGLIIFVISRANGPSIVEGASSAPSSAQPESTRSRDVANPPATIMPEPAPAAPPSMEVPSTDPGPSGSTLTAAPPTTHKKTPRPPPSSGTTAPRSTAPVAPEIYQ